jgi:class 3 adenylate cyclase/CHASE2 domain-containing sensor protein
MKANFENLKPMVGLGLIPCVWAVVAWFGGLDKLKNALLDQRFRLRGELIIQDGDVAALPVVSTGQKTTAARFPKLVYVDFDPQTLSSPGVGERPWDREFFAKVGNILLDERVGARAVGYDFIFSNKSMSKMVLEENVFASEQAIGDLIKKYPDKVVLGAHYSNVSFKFGAERVSGSPPLLYAKNYNQSMNRNYPEGPSYPMVFYENGKPRGRLGLVSAEMTRGKSSFPRWAPLFFPYEGDAHAKKQLLSLRFAYPIEQKKAEDLQDVARAEEEANKLREELKELETDKMREKLKARATERKTDIAFAPPELASIETRTELVRVKLEGAEKDVQAAQLKMGSVQAKPFAREGLRFEEDAKNGNWLMKEGDQVIGKVPQVRENPYFFHFSISMILATYGLDWRNVEISPQKLIIRDLTGNKIVDAGLADGQLLEVNWFSHWRVQTPGLTAIGNLGSHRDNQDHDAFFEDAETALLWVTAQILGQDASEEIGIPERLVAMNLSEAFQAEVERLLVKIRTHDGSEPLDEWHDAVMAIFSELGNKMMPTLITDQHNPRSSIINVLRYGDVYLNENNRKVIKQSFPVKLDLAIAQLEAKVSENPDHKDILAKLRQQKKDLPKYKEHYAQAEQFFSHFRDAMVVIGPVDPIFQDLAPTPFDDVPVPMVGFHGNLIKTLLTGKYIRRTADWVEYAGIFGLGFLMIFLGFYSGALSSWARPFGIALQVLFVVGAFLAFKYDHWVIPVAGPIGAALSTSFAGFAVKLVIEEKAKGRIKGMFGAYVSKELVDQMLESKEEPTLGGEETVITAFFSDVQAFSSFSELLNPTQLVELMNEYLTAMTKVVQSERGTLDKYNGDAIVAMFGAPIPIEDHAYQAVKTALLMQARQAELRQKWKSERGKWPEVVSLMRTRIGCNTGAATVGNMGSVDRFDYTMMGDMVNLGARCESAAKAYGVFVMVTEDTKRTAEAIRDDVAYRYLDKIVVRGRVQPVAMFEPIGFKNNLARDTQDCLDCFGQGIQKYLAQDWDGAMKAFEKAKELEPNRPDLSLKVKTNPSIILIERCMMMKQNPPGDQWDGVFVMSSK